MTSKEVREIDKVLEDALQQHPGLDSAKGKGKAMLRAIWPAIKGMLTIVRNTFGLLRPVWRLGIDAFVTFIDSYIALPATGGETTV